MLVVGFLNLDEVVKHCYVDLRCITVSVFLDCWRDKLRSLCYQKSEVDRALQIVQGKCDFGSSHMQFLFPAFKGNSSINWQCIG